MAQGLSLGLAHGGAITAPSVDHRISRKSICSAVKNICNGANYPLIGFIETLQLNQIDFYLTWVLGNAINCYNNKFIRVPTVTFSGYDGMSEKFNILNGQLVIRVCDLARIIPCGLKVLMGGPCDYCDAHWNYLRSVYLCWMIYDLLDLYFAITLTRRERVMKATITWSVSTCIWINRWMGISLNLWKINWERLMHIDSKLIIVDSYSFIVMCMCKDS